MYDRFDRRIHYLRISVTDLCNLRCVYCMPPEGVPRLRHGDTLSLEEIEELVRVAASLGIDRVRLTGGEPLVRRDILTLVKTIAAVDGIQDYAMTTNGTLLANVAGALRQAGMRRLNVSLDTVDPERYRQLTRGGDVARALAGIEAAMTAGFSPIKLNCVVRASPEEPDARAVGAYARERGLAVQFIRQMDTAAGKFWPVTGGNGGHCARCNRLRVSSNGLVYPCLLSDVSFSVRELGPERALRAAVAGKPVAGRSSRNAFYAIGG
jgi:cyclic pyranopterin phosphate synthase